MLVEERGEDEITIFGNFVSFMIRIINDTKEGVRKCYGTFLLHLKF